MIYLSGVVPMLRHSMLGVINTPRRRFPVPSDMTWAADNGRYSAPEDYSDERYIAWLMEQPAATCLFATAPDVLGDHRASVELSRPFFARLREAGYRAAFVIQDGWSDGSTPWDEFDVAFIGGTDAFKLGPAGVANRRRVEARQAGAYGPGEFLPPPAHRHGSRLRERGRHVLEIRARRERAAHGTMADSTRVSLFFAEVCVMTCRRIGNAIVCSRSRKPNRCSVRGCWRHVFALCDYPKGKSTCSKPLCRWHAKDAGGDLHYCLDHPVGQSELALGDVA